MEQIDICVEWVRRSRLWTIPLYVITFTVLETVFKSILLDSVDAMELVEDVQPGHASFHGEPEQLVWIFDRLVRVFTYCENLLAF